MMKNLVRIGGQRKKSEEGALLELTERGKGKTIITKSGDSLGDKLAVQHSLVSQGELVLSRRNLIKGIAVSAGASVAVGCAPDKSADIYPLNNNNNDAIPGLKAVYRSKCGECDAGCGIEVANIDGRAIKIEGSKVHPVNQGGLCALGQSALQALYDPDRVRVPLKRDVDSKGRSIFNEISWKEALGILKEKLSTKKGLLLHGNVDTSKFKALKLISSEYSLERVNLDLISYKGDQVKAVKEVFGEYGFLSPNFDEVDLLINFGAEFLETWNSPVEYSKNWSAAKKTRKGKFAVITIEPKMSLTGASSDKSLLVNPGSEKFLLALLLNELSSKGKVPAKMRSLVRDIAADMSVSKCSEKTGISEDDLSKVVNALLHAKNPGFIGVGSGGLVSSRKELVKLVLLANYVLGAYGKAVKVERTVVEEQDDVNLATLAGRLKECKDGVVVTYGTNPVYSLPKSLGLKQLLRGTKFVVSFSTALDDTAMEADLVLPIHHSLEDYAYDERRDGSITFTQAAMLPVFDSKSIEEIIDGFAPQLIDSRPLSEVYLTGEFNELLRKGAEIIDSRLVELNRTSELVKVDAIEDAKKWIQFSEGLVPIREMGMIAVAKKGELNEVNESALKSVRSLYQKEYDTSKPKLLPYYSVKNFDGQGANRAWLQELPCPLTNVVWDNQIEIHPVTAKEYKVAQGDYIAIRCAEGEIKGPVYISNLVAKNCFAVAIGQGHEGYGRYAVIKDSNVITLLDSNQTIANLSIEVIKLPSDHQMVVTAGSREQGFRGIAKNEVVKAEFLKGHESHSGNSHDDHHEGHHAHGRDMYDQRKHPLYQWGMVIDLDVCTGCSACVVACYAENNIPVVGKDLCNKGREMSWLQMQSYVDEEKGEINFVPMMCQHCGNAPCEPVCPVYATYHNEDGMNAMVYNRCVGTRYCSNNCSYKVRRFNWVDFEFPEPLNWQLNPNVTKRTMGVMEKCTFCVHRINEAKNVAKEEGRLVRDQDFNPACVEGCPTNALTFGNLLDPNSLVSKKSRDDKAYKILDAHINTKPSVSYLPKTRVDI